MKAALLSLLLAAPVLAQLPNQAPVIVSPADRFGALETDYWETQLRLSPLLATFVGDSRYADKLDDPGAAGRAEQRKEYARLLQAAQSLDIGILSPAQKVSQRVLVYELTRALDAEKHKFWQWNVDQMSGPQTWIATVIATSQPMKGSDDAQSLLLRMKGIPSYFASYIANLREGLRDGRVAARVPVEKTIAQLDELLQTPAAKTVYADAARKLPETVQDKVMPEILGAVETHVMPSLKSLRDFLRDEYLPKARLEKIGLSELPGGLDAYRYMIRYHTTLDLDPAEVHRLGLEEIKGIRGEMEALAKRLHHKGDLKSFLAAVRADPKNYFTTRDEVESEARRRIEATYAKLPKWFGVLPKTKLVVKRFEAYREKNEVDAEYFEPTDDGSRPGTYYVNTYKPETRARFHMAALAAHEGIPGHHFQIAIALETPGLPVFRRHGDYNAFVEGWALYTERLADEMGLYRDDMDRLGMLSMQAWRACRLVVDTGIHAFGWSRQRAIDYMKENTAMSDDEIAAEVDRYTIWPGQALAYKIGQHEFMDQREAAKKKLGKKFDIRKFHDDVLKNGPLPLPVLREVLK